MGRDLLAPEDGASEDGIEHGDGMFGTSDLAESAFHLLVEVSDILGGGEIIVGLCLDRFQKEEEPASPVIAGGDLPHPLDISFLMLFHEPADIEVRRADHAARPEH